MNKFKRSILSISRNLTKSFLLFFVSFILGTFIISSIHIFLSTSLVKSTVKTKLSPIVVVSVDKQKVVYSDMTGSEIIDLYTDEKREKLYSILESFRIDKRTQYGDHFHIVEVNGKSNGGWGLNGINSTTPIDYIVDDFASFEGRMFTEKEIANGDFVIILNEDPTGIQSENKNIGDIITYTYYNLNNENYITINFEVIGIMDCIQIVENVNGMKYETLDPGYMYYKYHNYFVPTKYNNAYIPYQTLKKIGDQLIKLETKRQQNLSEDFKGIIKDETAGKLTFTEAIFQLTSVDYLENFVDNLKTELEEYPELSISSSVDSYLDVKDSVNSLEKLSVITFVISILSSFIVLTLIIYVYIKNRKNEVGLYIALGELKRNIILQLTFEVLIICLLGFMLSYTTGKIFSQKITNHLIQTEEVFEEYNQDELMNVVEGNSLDQYMIDIIGLEIIIIILSSCYPLIKIMKTKPKEVLQ